MSVTEIRHFVFRWAVGCSSCSKFVNDMEGGLEMLPHEEGTVLSMVYHHYISHRQYRCFGLGPEMLETVLYLDVCCRQFAHDIEGVLELLLHKEGNVLAQYAICFAQLDALRRHCAEILGSVADAASQEGQFAGPILHHFDMFLLTMCRQFANDIEGVLEMLPHKEGDVLALRYGLFNGEPKSLRDAANLLKMSTEGVRKSELTAFRYDQKLFCTEMPY